MRGRIFLTGLLALAAVAILAAYGYVSLERAAPTLRTPSGADITLLVADTDEMRVRGLGEREALPKDVGMLFVFPESARHEFWMKGMQFSLDIVWLEETTPSQSPLLKRGRGKKTLLVVDVKEDIATSTYPDSFTPLGKARYVLEINAGVVRETGIRVGEALVLRYNEKPRR